MSQDEDTTIENARASIKSDIEKLITADQVLRQQLNRFDPISSLPPEIMTNIFSFVRDASTHPLHWIKITHVCRYWREVALHAPGLWSRPPLANLPWTVEMLARSKQVNITFESDSQKYYTGQYEGYREAFKHAARIRYIILDFSTSTSEEWLNSVMDNLPISAPRLETLLIDIQPLREGYFIQRDALVNVPNLRRLSLTGCGPNWDAHWLPQITHLKLCNIAIPEQLTMSRLITALEKMSNLESLILFDSCHSARGTVPSNELDQAPLTNIKLLQLRMLSIWDEFSVVEPFFRYVTFPPDADVSVIFFPDEELPLDLETDGVRFTNVLRDIAKSYSNVASSYIFDTLIVDYLGKTTSQIRFGMFDGLFTRRANLFGQSADTFWEVKPARRGLSLAFETYTTHTHACFNVIFHGVFLAGFPLNNITHAHIGSQIPLEEHSENPQLLAETVGKLPSLSFIEASMLAGPWILCAAMHHASKDVGTEPMLSSTPFPRLNSIHFYEVPFLPSNTMLKGGFVDRELLLQFLVIRRQTVRRCQLIGCFNLTTEDVDELRKLVGDVVCWDEMEPNEHDYKP